MSVRVDIAGQQNMVFQIYMLFCFGALLSLGLQSDNPAVGHVYRVVFQYFAALAKGQYPASINTQISLHGASSFALLAIIANAEGRVRTVPQG